MANCQDILNFRAKQSIVAVHERFDDIRHEKIIRDKCCTRLERIDMPRYIETQYLPTIADQVRDKPTQFILDGIGQRLVDQQNDLSRTVNRCALERSFYIGAEIVWLSGGDTQNPAIQMVLVPLAGNNVRIEQTLAECRTGCFPRDGAHNPPLHLNNCIGWPRPDEIQSGGSIRDDRAHTPGSQIERTGRIKRHNLVDQTVKRARTVRGGTD